MLLMLFRAVVAAREREDQRIIPLKLAESAQSVRVIGQLVVGKGASRHDVRAHTWTPSTGELGAAHVDGASDSGGRAKKTLAQLMDRVHQLWLASAKPPFAA